MAEYILTVDDQDRETGYMEKMEVHRKGILHRAFSVLIINHKGELLLQKRARRSITRPDFGQTAAAAIKGKARPLRKQYTEGSGTNWGSRANAGKHSHSSTALNLIMALWRTR